MSTAEKVREWYGVIAQSSMVLTVYAVCASMFMVGVLMVFVFTAGCGQIRIRNCGEPGQIGCNGDILQVCSPSGWADTQDCGAAGMACGLVFEHGNAIQRCKSEGVTE